MKHPQHLIPGHIVTGFVGVFRDFEIHWNRRTQRSRAQGLLRYVLLLLPERHFTDALRLTRAGHNAPVAREAQIDPVFRSPVEPEMNLSTQSLPWRKGQGRKLEVRLAIGFAADCRSQRSDQQNRRYET